MALAIGTDATLPGRLGHQGEPASTPVAAKAMRRDSGGGYVSAECVKRLDAFRFRGPCVSVLGKALRRGVCEAVASVASREKMSIQEDSEVLNAMDAPMTGEYPGSDGTICLEDGGSPSRCLEGEEYGLPEHENVLTDYGSTSMFDDEESWFRDDNKGGYTELDVIPINDGANANKLLGALVLGASGGLAPLEGFPDRFPGPNDRCHYGEDQEHSDGITDLLTRDPSSLGAGTRSANNDTTLESYKELLGPPTYFTEEGFFSDEVITQTVGHTPNSIKRRRSEPSKKEDKVIVVRCRAADIPRNGRIRWIDVTESVRKSKKRTSAWPVFPEKSGILEPIERPPFPAVVSERLTIPGLSAALTVKTCFHIKDALEVGSLVAGGQLKGDVLVELFAKVVHDRETGNETRQNFRFCDIFLIGPPFLHGEYNVPKGCGPWDTDSKVFRGTAMVRAIGRMRKRNSTMEWVLQIQNIREADWHDVKWAKGIICGNGVGRVEPR